MAMLSPQLHAGGLHEQGRQGFRHHNVDFDGDDEFDSASAVSEDASAPAHPIPQLQEAFEESIVEAAEHVQYETVPKSSTHPSAEVRRQHLLDQDSYDDSWNSRWRQRSSARCHPLTKLIAQIVFGMHLLYNYQAKSDAEVVKILQTHVDDIDGFLEKNTDDFNLAIQDIEERLTFLSLPMTHIDVFDVMLDDKTFRTQLVEGNHKIEKIIKRTAKAMNAALSDVEQGISAVEELAKYLDEVKDDWPEDYTELPAIFAAMRGNQEGWQDCFHELRMKGNKLGVLLVQLGTTIREMNTLAAAASRRSMRLTRDVAPRSKYSTGGSLSKPSRHSRHMSKQSLDKPLPQEPDPLQPAIQATLPKPRHQESSSVEKHDTRSRSKSYSSHKRTASKLESRHKQTASSPGMLTTIIRHSGPLNSNPPPTSASDHTMSPGFVPMSDSAYGSGSDPGAEKRIQKRANNAARFGLFPDSKPTTPESFSRPSSARTTTPASTAHPVRPRTSPAPAAPATLRSSHFSLRRIFQRRSRIHAEF